MCPNCTTGAVLLLELEPSFYLQTDTSHVLLADTISDGRELSITSTCLLLNGPDSAQQKYTAGEVECWTLIASNRKLRDFLKAASGIIFCPIVSLHCLRRQRDPRENSRMDSGTRRVDYEVRYVEVEITEQLISFLGSRAR